MTFANNRVLRDVAIEVRPGEIHGLVGQNGSGKSTLAKVLTGLYHPDPGTRVSVDGTELKLPVQPREARERGVAVVHQSLGLFDDDTVLENLRIGRHRASRVLRRIDWKHERAQARAVFERLGRDIPLDARVGTLREEQRATVAIARALQDATPGRGLIIFDESTRALGRPSLEHFFRILDDIVQTGTSVLLITHRLEEIIDAADRVTVLRDGRIVEMGRSVEGLDEAALAELMLGTTLTHEVRGHASTMDAAARPITVAGLHGGEVADASLQVRPGEVLGLTGIAGSGYDDVPYLLSGVTPPAAGSLTLSGGELGLHSLTPGDAIAAGVVLVPEGREHAGLAMGMSVQENTVFPQTSRARAALKPFARSEERAQVADWIDRLDVRPPDPSAIVGTLSGGNQQKVLLAKWLAMDPELLLLHEPTQAVDVGARQTIVAAVRAAAASGRAVIVAGGDENELSLLCDRVVVFEDGRVSRELTEDLTPENIVRAIYTQQGRSRLRARSTDPSMNEEEKKEQSL
ncbi:sugar ABC transporter ATP-binding protein [Microbacterium protaetiae]|uniref:Sugar ABC transporter ATP-binding protein n=2 Tax=Microbacterium protaetiae TaxID=2509458 RepID=A0A4P6EDN1_9MICO|nr:sugar ABC transporter ATP-binding protein [Microbacterium protaetiae]